MNTFAFKNGALKITAYTKLVSGQIRAQYDLCWTLIDPDKKSVKDVWTLNKKLTNNISMISFNLPGND